MSRIALITGITGQDGSYLAELLLGKGYHVHGLTRSLCSERARGLQALLAPRLTGAGRLELHAPDHSDSVALIDLIVRLNPAEIYNLASQSHVGASFRDPLATLDANARIALLVLEAARVLHERNGQGPRVYQAGSSEMFGAPDVWPQTEATPFRPRSPYACSKVYAFHQVVNYREAYGLPACNGILYNHESPRRTQEYVTRKITRGAARIFAGLQKELALGNLDVGRDWGFAQEYVEAMWLMLQQPDADDFIVATNQWHTLHEFLDVAFGHVGLDWRGFVRRDRQFERPVEVTRLQGDYSKARRVLGWSPRTRFEDLVRMMVDADLAALGRPSLSATART